MNNNIFCHIRYCDSIVLESMIEPIPLISDEFHSDWFWLHYSNNHSCELQSSLELLF